MRKFIWTRLQSRFQDQIGSYLQYSWQIFWIGLVIGAGNWIRQHFGSLNSSFPVRVSWHSTEHVAAVFLFVCLLQNNISKRSTIAATQTMVQFFKERIQTTASQAFRFSYILVIAFGILGNILVIISISRQGKLLKSNYYFLVLHLGICDLGYLVVRFFEILNSSFVDLFEHSVIYCLVIEIKFIFLVAGIFMMLIISVQRYRATVHPLKPAITRQKLKVICVLGYVLGVIATIGTGIPGCLMVPNYVDVRSDYIKFYYAYIVFCFLVFPTTSMAVVYYKIGRALMKQNEQMKRVFSNAVRNRYVRNRRTYAVCLGTVLCYGVGVLSLSVWYTWYIGTNRYLQYHWIRYFSFVVSIAGSNSGNPLIYGVLDKKLFTFWRQCFRRNVIVQWL